LKQYNLPLPVALGACLATGLLCGIVNGALVIKWQLPSFIVTLGMLQIASGCAYLLTHSQTLYIGNDIEVVSAISFHGLSLPFLIAVVIVIAGQVVLSGTVFGRHMLALGANPESARLSGIATRAATLAVFAISGLMSAVAGIIQCSRLGASDPNAGIGFELQTIAAVVIGGTSLMGGRGSVINSFFGVLIIAVLSAGLTQMQAGEPAKRLITGAVIIAAVIVDYYRTRLTER
jgi:ribose transport system permease protein